jgi:transposase
VHPKNETQKQGKGCTMPEGKRRVFNREFKVSVVERILAGESGAALSRELHIRESQLGKWCRHFRWKGPDGLRRAGRPRKSLDPADLDPSSRPKGVDNLAAARERISELECKIGQQQVELDFFRDALRHVGEARRPSAGSGVKASTLPSRR